MFEVLSRFRLATATRSESTLFCVSPNPEIGKPPRNARERVSWPKKALLFSDRRHRARDFPNTAFEHLAAPPTALGASCVDTQIILDSSLTANLQHAASPCSIPYRGFGSPRSSRIKICNLFGRDSPVVADLCREQLPVFGIKQSPSPVPICPHCAF